MDFDTSLELQLEILTLVKNIKQFKKYGWSTENLQNRLKFCRSKQKVLKVLDENSFKTNFIKQQSYRCCV
jgi:hypothetical protein